MKRLAVVAAFAAVVAMVVGSLPVLAQQQAAAVEQQQGISVLGEGIVLADPNVARLSLGVDVFNVSLAAAQTDAANRMDQVVQHLKAAGIPEQDIKTVQFSINPQYDNRDNQGPVLRGYQIQNIVEARVTDLSKLGSLIDDVVNAGATRVNGIRFENGDMAGLKNTARDQAMQNARNKAEQLARLSGVSLGRPVYIEESDTGGVNPVVMEAAPAAAQGVRATTPIQPGQLQVRTTVRVIWGIQ